MKKSIKTNFIFLILLIILSACSQSRFSSNINTNRVTGNYQTGIASYYADKYQGRQTANGERFNQNAPTAAHRTLRFGTWVKVTNVNNGKSVKVRINDRGPFVKGRVIDLSKSAFDVIANPRLGIVRVAVEILQ